MKFSLYQLLRFATGVCFILGGFFANGYLLIAGLILVIPGQEDKRYLDFWLIFLCLLLAMMGQKAMI